MTNEEAIDIIKCLAWHTRPNEEDIEQAIKALEQEPYDDAKYHEEHGEVIVDKAVWEDAKRALEQEPKTGHWKRISMDKYSEHAKYWYRCDRCGKDNLGNTDWCPNCGARMD